MTAVWVKLVDTSERNRLTEVQTTLDLIPTDPVAARNYWLKHIEKLSSQAEDIGDGVLTIGYGFNMDTSTARAQWDTAFGGSLNFDTYHVAGGPALTESQASTLLTVSADARETAMLAISDFAGITFSASEKIALLSMYYTNPSIFGTGIKAAIDLYKNGSTVEIRSDAFQNILIQIVEESNGDPNATVLGQASRRLQEANLFANRTDVEMPWREYQELLTKRPDAVAAPSAFTPTALPFGHQENDFVGAASTRVVDGQDTLHANDIYYGSSNADSLTGGAGDEVLFGGNGNDSISGGDGNDYLAGNAGSDTLDGGAGKDFLHGGSDSETAIDYASYASSSSAVHINLATNVATGGDAEGDKYKNIEGIVGSAHDDELIGNNSNNYFNGGAGSDTLNGGLGNDVLDGGSDTIGGSDKADYSDRAQGLDIKITELANAPVTPLSVGGKESDTIVEIERIDGTNLGDKMDIRLLNNTALHEINTGAGADDITVIGSQNGFRPVIHLGAGDDTIEAAPQGSIVYGDADNDTFKLGKNYLIADAENGDRLTHGGQILHGGNRNESSESPWTNWNQGVRYGIDSDGELQVQDTSRNVTYVGGFHNGMAGINVGTLSMAFYPLHALPRPTSLDENFQVLAQAEKNKTGESFYQGVDPLVLDLDGDGLELNALTGGAPLFDIDADGNGAGASIQIAIVGSSTHPTLANTDFTVID